MSDYEMLSVIIAIGMLIVTIVSQMRIRYGMIIHTKITTSDIIHSI